MNRLPDVELVLRDYLADTGDRAPDRVLNDVAARIAHQPRRAWRLRGRPFLNTYAKLGLAAAAALIVAVVGWQLLPGNGGIGGRPTPAPTPTLPPTPVASARVVHRLPDGQVPPGTYRLQPFGSMEIEADVPEGWSGARDFAVLGPFGTAVPGGIGIAFMRVDGLFRDPCRWDLNGTGAYDQPGDITVGPSVDDLVTALRANTSYTSSNPRPVTVGGYSGQQLDVQLPSDIDFNTCDAVPGNPGAYFPFSGVGAGLYAQGPGNRWTTSILDAAGTRLVIVMTDYTETPVADRNAAQGIFDSLAIYP